MHAVGCGDGNQRGDAGHASTDAHALEDVLISAITEEVFAVGGATGEEWASFTAVTDIAFDAAGRLVLVDNRQKRVVIVTADGRHLRDVSRPGDGPGELRSPTWLAPMRDGRLVVYDLERRSLLAFGPDGELAEHVRLQPSSRGFGGRSVAGTPSDLIAQLRSSPIGVHIRDVRALPDGRLLMIRTPSNVSGKRPIEVYEWEEGMETLFMAWDLPEGAVAQSGDVQSFPMSGDAMSVVSSRGVRRPVFAPPLFVDVMSNGRVAVVDSVGYRIKLLSPNGEIDDVLRRPIPARRVTSEIKQAVVESMRAGTGAQREITVSTGSGISREIMDEIRRRSLEDRISQATFADQIPVIANMAVDSEDRIWVGRAGADGVSAGPTDVLDSEGNYLGTLPGDGLRIPRAFGPGGLMAYVQRDELDAPVIRVVRLLALESSGVAQN